MRYVPSDLPSEHVDRTFTGQAESAARPRNQKAGCMKENYYYLLVRLSQIFYAVSVPYISARFVTAEVWHELISVHRFGRLFNGRVLSRN